MPNSRPDDSRKLIFARTSILVILRLGGQPGRQHTDLLRLAATGGRGLLQRLRLRSRVRWTVFFSARNAASTFNVFQEWNRMGVVLSMKRIALAMSLLVVGGTASAAMFVPTPEPVRALAAPAKIGSVMPSSAPGVAEAKRAPVPYMPLPRAPEPQIASLPEPPPDFSQIRPAEPQRAPNAKLVTANSIERNPQQAVRDLSSDGACKGRALTSIRVEGDGRVIVQC